MTQSKAASVSSALINAGYQSDAIKLPDGSWSVTAVSTDGTPVQVSTVQTFATNNGVVALTDRATFS